MAILTRVTRKEYPGALTEIRVPFVCTNYPTIQELAALLMTGSAPSVIIEGKIFTEQAKGIIETACEAI
ncbi:MAG: hypothetical protein KAY24_20190 [Candidatus Eisenbacteria sp.]|nr:hypothetical protein [Candidatus Eisenbacteria bacterium]